MVKCLCTMFSEITHSIQRPGGAHLCILPAITICWQLPFPSPTLLWKSMYITQRQPESSITNQRSTPAASLFPCVWNYSPTKKKKTFNHLLVRQIGGEYLLLTTAPIFWHFRVSSTTINFNGSPMISIFFQPITILALLYWYVSTMDWGQIRIGRLYSAYCCHRMGSDKKSIISFFHRLAKSMYIPRNHCCNLTKSFARVHMQNVKATCVTCKPITFYKCVCRTCPSRITLWKSTKSAES